MTRSIALAAVTMLTHSCGGGDAVEVLPVHAGDPLTTIGDIPVLQGGFGSSLSVGAEGNFYLLTDRGPNYDAGPETKAFPLPGFNPQVGIFRRTANALELTSRIPLLQADGKPLTGLPHPPGEGATGETALSPEGAPLALDPVGIDPEGLHVLDDGSFWVADEYGPWLMHFGADGRLIERLGLPVPGAARSLPAVLARRRPNYGFEGLTGDRSGGTLVALMQSPLRHSPDDSIASMIRIIAVDTRSGGSRQYLYPLDEPGFFATEISQLTPSTFLVLERDNGFLGGNPPARHKKVFLIDLSGATDVSDSANAPEGRRIGARPLETLSQAELAGSGIRPAKKSIVVDLLALGYPHDKPEGLVVLSPTEIAVINDDDFGLVDAGGGKPGVKRLPATGEPDRNALWIIRLPSPLVLSPR